MPSQHGRSGRGGEKLRSIHPAIILPLFTIMLIIGGLALHLTGIFAAPPGQIEVAFPGTVPALVARSHLQGAANPNSRISLSIGLRPRNGDALTAYAQDISRRNSVNYHRFLTPAQVAGVFGPSKTTYDAMLSFLQGAGFTITQTYTHHLLIAFSGTIGQVEQTFHVTINNYTGPNGRTYYSNSGNPVLPSELVGAVQSISGLSNATQWRHPPLPATSHLERSSATSSATSCPAHGSGYLTPDQIASAYNLNGLYSAGYHGEGQTVALFELDTFQMSDLTNYEACFGHAHTVIQTIVTGQGSVPTDGGVAEVELDAELVLGAAPQLGELKIYEAANDSNSTANYNAEWAQIVQDAPPVVSTSWGACEQDVGLQEAQQENIFFTVAATQGQSIFSASGDWGSAGCAYDATNPTPPPYVNNLIAFDPAAQPFVTGVGGTSLTMNGTGYGSETTWNNTIGGSGGGISQFWSTPAWQSAPGVSNQFSSGTPCGAQNGGTCREVPDVSLSGDPNNGYMIYCTSPAVTYCSKSNPWVSIGGTSAAAPMWAAMMAIANEMSLKTGNFNLGFVNPLLYQVASNASNYANSFHDVTTGNNDYINKNNGSYPATVGYDMATGLGSYNALVLASNLVSLAQTATGPRSSPANTTWYFAEGSVGGSFQEWLTLQNPSATQDASVNITYLFQSRAAVTVPHKVPVSSRVTVNVNQDLNIPNTAPQQAISAIVQVTSGPGIVAERPMYFNLKGIASGTDVVGATSPGMAYYFPEADTRQVGRNYYTYITMLNPSSSQTATAIATFYTGSCGQTGQAACPTQSLSVLPLHRGTIIPPSNTQMSISVTSTLPMVVERPMYFKDTIANAGGLTTGAASEVGATAPGNDWLFAEGYTGPDFQEYFVLSNFGSTSTTANIDLEYSNGHTQTVTVTVPAFGQTRFDVNAANANPTGTCDVMPCQTTTTASAEITSAAPIVADRLMYFHYGSSHFSGGTDTVGEAGPASHNVYSFAEGYTANTFQEFLTLQNPTNNDEAVAVTLFADTYVIQQQVTVKAHSRQTVNINGLLVPIAQAYTNGGANAYAVSLSVQALGTGTKIVAERPMYFNFYGDQGGTDVIGYTGG